MEQHIPGPASAASSSCLPGPFISAPAWLALLLALAMPQHRGLWLALLLLAALVLSLMALLVVPQSPRPGGRGAWPVMSASALLMLASLLLPLPMALLLLAALRLALSVAMCRWQWGCGGRPRPLPGFPALEAALVLASGLWLVGK